MLVSAAIEPYRKSYGYAESSSATLEGSSASDRMIASPRKMCVPGVQAWATAGVNTSASNTASATRPAENARDEARGIPRALDPDALTLPPHCFAEVVQLVFHGVVDRILGGIHIVKYLVHHVVQRNTIDQIFAALHRRPESAVAGPLRPSESRRSRESGTASRITNEGTNRTPPRRPTSQEQRHSGANRGPDDSRGQQVVLLLTLLVQFHFWGGRAGAVSPNRRLCFRRSPHR